MKLEAASMSPPPGLQELLDDLDGGENGFGGTPVHSGEVTLVEYLQRCCDMPDPAKLRPGLVPQTMFWALDDNGDAVGIVRLRHYLNDDLRIRGGHVGYYVRRDQRGKGYAKQMLRLALDELRQLGEQRVLITTDLDNVRSMRVIEANGGKLSDVSTHPQTGEKLRRYWIDLDP